MPHDTLPPPIRRALVADLFCGAGGSSTGARRALAVLGYRMSLVAVNHWNVAIDTHSRNHPDARHFIQDVNVAKPAALVPEGKLDLLMASPTCTFHSRARGGKPINDQGRMDPWAVVHWCTELRVKRLLVENVPEFRDWGPLDLRTGRPLKRRRGEYFRAWITALRGAGFTVEWRVLNAADFGDATTRERFFLIGRSDGKKIHWPAPTHSRRGAADLLGHGAQKWRAAREIIDWSIPGKSIFARKRPLSPKTLARIYAGAVKFRWPEPFLVVLRNHMDAQSLDDPVPTLCAGGTHIGLAEPVIFQMNQGKERRRNIRSAADPVCTITASGTDLGLAEPFILNRHGENGAIRAHSVDDPVPTADCRGAGYMVEPCLIKLNGRSDAADIDAPAPTITGHAHLALAEPFIATLAHGNEPNERDPNSRRCRSLDDPLQTITTGGGKFGIVESFVLSQASYDIRFRMLEPKELARAMGFNNGETDYEFAGTKTDITRQIGNAVCVNLAAALVAAIFR